MTEAGTGDLDARRRIDRPAAPIGVALMVVLFVLFAGCTGQAKYSAAGPALGVLFTAGPWAVLWLAAAMGFGWPLREALAKGARAGLAIQAGLGVAALLWLDGALGALGALQLGGSAGAWAVLAIGWVLLIAQMRRAALRAAPDRPWSRLLAPHWLIWAAAPTLAVLLLACCSAPGWLWSSEFGGYDALSYHLQLPKEWLQLGRISGLEHNVYSFLPGCMEAAYYHLAILHGDAIASVYAAQFLHAGITIITAIVTGRLAARWGGRAIGAATFVLMLATPWTIVVGSLAYNEMAVTLMLATGLLVLDEEDMDSARRGACIGVLAGAACGSKLTAIGFAALPLAVLLAAGFARRRQRRWFIGLACGGLAGLIVLLPYLLRNWIQTGNPVFPFATGLLGAAHWAAEQAAIFAQAHAGDRGLAGRLVEGWNELMRYGIGPNPDASATPDPWLPQWSILPWLALAGVLLALTRKERRGCAARCAVVVLVQIAFWLFLTHGKSRFMLPAVVPMALCAALGARSLGEQVRLPRSSGRIIGAVILLLLACLPAWIFAREQNGRPCAAIGAAEVFTGDAHAAQLGAEGITPQERAEIMSTAPPAYWINHALGGAARVLCVGDATPLYYRGDVTYQTTWDRGPMSRIVTAHPADPGAWIEALRAQGFTHVLLDETMLRLWAEEGWGDPNLEPEVLRKAFDAHAHLVRRFTGGMSLYRLE